MKRVNNLFKSVCDLDNIFLADSKARKNKTNKYGVKRHDKNKVINNFDISLALEDGTYKTSKYSTFKIYEPKERIIYRLPYNPDRIVHHAIMNITEPIWMKIFTKDTYSCIKERGIHKLAKDLKKVLNNDPDGTKYCLKLDIKKFYPSISHNKLKEIIRRKIKDNKLLVLLDEIIDSVDMTDIGVSTDDEEIGVPIGNYLSLFFANLFLAYFDHWIKEEVKTEFSKRGATLYYFRYADDIIVLSNDKEVLRYVLILIKIYLKHELKLSIKDNYLVFPVSSRGIDFIGYVFYHTHILLRKSIKNRIWKLINQYESKEITKEELLIRMASYFGWLKYCNSKNLLRKIENRTGIRYSNWNGIESKISKFKNKSIYVVNIELRNKYYVILFIYKNKPYFVKSRNGSLLFYLGSQQLPTVIKL